MTPFQAIHARDPPPIIRYEHGSTPCSDVEKQPLDCAAMLAKMNQHLQHAHNRMKMQADTHRCDSEFDVGDRVFLKFQPYPLKSLASRPYEKLAPRYSGPFKVLAQVDQVVYKLELPSHAAIHPVFHVSQLKRALGTEVVLTSLPPQLANDLELRVEHEAVLGFRPGLGHPGHHLEVLCNGKACLHSKLLGSRLKCCRSSFPPLTLRPRLLFGCRVMISLPSGSLTSGMLST